MASLLLEASAPRSRPLLVRKTHLATIAEAMSSGVAGGVVLAGPAGAGRTRLAREAVERAEAEGFATQVFTADPVLSGVSFGAFARLLAGVDRTAQDRLQWFLAALVALRDAAGGRRLVVAVDDAHFLDPAGAALIHGLASTKAAFVLATVRTGARCPEPVLALWRDGLAPRLELASLSPAGSTPPLTPREWEVATLAARGLSNRQVAGHLFISLRTVENHLHRAFSKLGVASRHELHHVLEAAPFRRTSSPCSWTPCGPVRWARSPGPFSRLAVVLSPLQERVAAIVSGLPEAAEFALAGGAALITRGDVERQREDLDFFATGPEAVDHLLPALEVALAEAGIEVERQPTSPTCSSAAHRPPPRTRFGPLSGSSGTSSRKASSPSPAAPGARAARAGAARTTSAATWRWPSAPAGA